MIEDIAKLAYIIANMAVFKENVNVKMDIIN